MRLRLHLLLLGCLSGLLAYAQTPHLTGDVYISLKDGLIRADVMVSRLPATTHYTLRLNSGFNVQAFRDSADVTAYTAEKTYDGDNAYESFQYWFPSQDRKSRFLPRQLRVRYVGAFPVHRDSLKRNLRGDWKGNIAFNGKTVRAAEQATWYPVLYDTLQDRLYQNVTFDLTIHCPEAKAIYVNGCPPQYGQTARFRSDIPLPLLLFAGDFDFKKEQSTYLVNTSLSNTQAAVLDSWLTRIKTYYAQQLQKPYGTDITLLASTPTSRRNDWLFVTYPTIASVSPTGFLNTMVDEQKRALTDSANLSFIAHELGHYYFGSVLAPNATLRWAFLEGMTEYLSLQAIRELVGTAAYERQLKQYVGASKGLSPFVALKDVRRPDEVTETYRYQYVPLLLTAMERQLGRDQLWKWLRTILNSQNALTDYAFFRNTLLESGVAAKDVDALEQTYLTTGQALPNLLAQFKSKATQYYYWGFSREVRKPGDTRKPSAFYTSIKTIPLDEAELSKQAQRYFAHVKSNCDPANEMCTSDFNSYETADEAKQAQQRWLKRYGETYTLTARDY
ncbi:hypothetical protein FAES_3842 [Fibrella aestuarina BUZ 2]|uniref:Peptidase M1 membrane alanine aminopeptidase domain-containing protein n=1 Tax=Fibrella aestuarina BUZ 2 TaxID=1166018 RepID=I0KCJ6_9BACT|nr:hypothetical protein [Fibrella aestuarina]CCH01849.1 hypothetical protein FAES_3842 [Fibrella aestuarina BUZ 2]